MDELNPTPRVLADDLLLTATGRDHLGRFKLVSGYTLAYIAEMGGKIAPAGPQTAV